MWSRVLLVALVRVAAGENGPDLGVVENACAEKPPEADAASIAAGEDYSDGKISNEEDQMSASAELDAIEARLTEDEKEYAGGFMDQSARDRRYLLSLVQEQAAKLEAIAVMIQRADIHGNCVLFVHEVQAALEGSA